MLKTNLLLFGLLLLGFILRVGVLQQFPLDFDVNRDLITATHIAKYNEYPIIGPENSYFYVFGNSPFYYYFLAIFVWIFGSYAVLGWVNLIFQVITLLFIYLFAKELFGKKVGLMAMVLATVSSVYIYQSSFIYQPYIMMPFLTASFWILGKSYNLKSVKTFVVSLSLLFISAGMHMSALLVSPLYFLTAVWLLIKSKNKIKSLLLMLVGVFIPFLIVFLPVLYYRHHQINSIFFTSLGVLLNNYASIPGNFGLVFGRYIGSLLNSMPVNGNVALLICLFIFGFCVWILNLKKSSNIFPICLVSQIFIYILILVLFADGQEQLFREHRFYPIIILGTVIISYVLNYFLETLKAGVILWVLSLFVLAILSVYGLQTNIFPDPNIAAIDITQKIESRVKLLATKEKNYRFFQIRVYECHEKLCDWKIYSYSDAIFWNPLESSLKTNFIKINSDNYENINRNNYIFVVCLDHSRSLYNESSCLQTFRKENPHHYIVEKISDNQEFHLYLTQKQ